MHPTWETNRLLCSYNDNTEMNMKILLYKLIGFYIKHSPFDKGRQRLTSLARQPAHNGEKSTGITK